MMLTRVIIAAGLSQIFLFPEGTNSQSLYNLGTIIVSDTQPNLTGPPANNTKCTRDKCEGLVWILYSNAYRQKEFGTIFKGAINSKGKNIICRQLGYKNVSSGPTPPHSPVYDPVPVWLTDVDCSNAPEDATNILECSHTICGSNCNDHNNDFAISCFGELHPKDPDSDRYYDGEVFLAAPEEKVNGMQTTFGVIQIKMYGTIKSITISNVNDTTSFDDSKRNSICKQMGFTEAVTDSVFTVGALQNTFNFKTYHSSSWFNINATTLNEQCNGIQNTPARCFGCCYDYGNINSGGCGPHECNVTNALVIACTYDSLNTHPDSADKGNQGICEFVDEKLPHGREACNYQGLTTGEKVLLSFYVLTTIIFVILLVLTIFYFKNLFRFCKKSEYNQIEN